MCARVSPTKTKQSCKTHRAKTTTLCRSTGRRRHGSEHTDDDRRTVDEVPVDLGGALDVLLCSAAKKSEYPMYQCTRQQLNHVAERCFIDVSACVDREREGTSRRGSGTEAIASASVQQRTISFYSNDDTILGCGTHHSAQLVHKHAQTQAHHWSRSNAVWQAAGLPRGMAPKMNDGAAVTLHCTQAVKFSVSANKRQTILTTRMARVV